MQRFEVRKQSGNNYEVWDNALRRQQAAGVSKRQAERLVTQGNAKGDPIPRPSVIRAEARRLPVRKAIGR